MYNVKIFNNISKVGLARLTPSYRLLDGDADAAAAVDVILCRSASLHDIEISKDLKAIGRAGAGVNNIPVAKMTTGGVVVFNTPGANANAVRELTVAGLIMSARNIDRAVRFVREIDDNAPDLNERVEQAKRQFVGGELENRTLGVIGLGSIGRSVAETALALNMRVIGYDPKITVDGAWQLSRAIDRARSVEDLVSRSEFVTIHVPLNDATQAMFDRDLIRRMKPGAVLVNNARQPIVDESAVLEALESKHLAAFVSDFPAAGLKSREDVISTPHLGASTVEAEENCARMVVDQVRDYVENGNIKNSVNFPAVHMERGSVHRLFVVNRNVPNMVGQISTLLARANLNIQDMINQSRGEIACTITDVDAPIPEGVFNAIRSLDGVLTARLL